MTSICWIREILITRLRTSERKPMKHRSSGRLCPGRPNQRMRTSAAWTQKMGSTAADAAQRCWTWTPGWSDEVCFHQLDLDYLILILSLSTHPHSFVINFILYFLLETTEKDQKEERKRRKIASGSWSIGKSSSWSRCCSARHEGPIFLQSRGSQGPWTKSKPEAGSQEGRGRNFSSESKGLEGEDRETAARVNQHSNREGPLWARCAQEQPSSQRCSEE